MPPFNDVKSLKDFSRERVMQMICEVILDEIFTSDDPCWDAYGPPCLPMRLEIVKEVLVNSIGPSLMEEILNIILHLDGNIEPTTRYLALQILLVKGINTLAIGHFPENYYTFLLDAIAKSAADLKRLDLRGLWVRTDDKNSLFRVLRRIHQVEHLVLRYVCDDDILSCVGKHCHCLRRFDISGSLKVSDEGIQSLISNPSVTPANCKTFCDSLVIVDIGGPGAFNLPMSVAKLLLLNLPNLKSLGSYHKAGALVENILYTHPNSTFKLQYIHDVGTKSNTLIALSKACQNVKAIYLDSPGGAAVRHLHMLTNLSEIKLNKVKWADVLELLGACGKTLLSLTLMIVWGNLDLLKLGELCPDIVRLELHSVNISCYGNTHATALHKLKELFIYTTQITTDCIKMIVNQTRMIEHISLGDCRELTDAAVICCLMDGRLRSANNIWFAIAENLTYRTVDALLQYCPHLTALGNLASWDVSDEEVAILKSQLEANNKNLTVHHYGPEEEEGVVVMIF